MFEVLDDRHFPNQFSDWNEASSLFEHDDKEKQEFLKLFLTMLDQYEKQLKDFDITNTTIYTGLAGFSVKGVRVLVRHFSHFTVNRYSPVVKDDVGGQLVRPPTESVTDRKKRAMEAGIGYFYYRLFKANPALISGDVTHSAGIRAKEMFDQCLRQCDLTKLTKNVSVFTSSTGVLLLGALLSPTSVVMGGKQSGSSSYGDNCLKRLLDAHVQTLDVGSGMPDEALYGRVGYLVALLTAKQSELSIPSDIVLKVTNAVIQSGLNNAKSDQLTNYYRKLLEKHNPHALPLPPLMYEWHEKAYLGAAHGFAGILLTLLKVHKHFPEALSSGALQRLVLPTMEWFCQLQMPSGNWPSSIGKHMDEDRLVHWCHGATGAVPLLLLAHEVTGKTEYMQRALRAGECIWHRGLLYKGCGLCHGSAGSGYAHLALYHASRDRKHLYRAVKFAEWCTDYAGHRTRIPDRPLSLFEDRIANDQWPMQFRLCVLGIFLLNSLEVEIAKHSVIDEMKNPMCSDMCCK